MERYEAVLTELKTKGTQKTYIGVDEAETSERIVIHATLNGCEITASNDGYFAAFQEFRDRLLEMGYGIKCSGSRLNAVQSGMMSATDKIYLVRMGRQALSEDLAHIWDYDDIEAFSDTNGQNEFFEQWTASF